MPRQNKTAGFTLVELLVVTPIIILSIGAMVGFMISLTGDALQSRERNLMQYDTRSGLSTIEDDIRRSTSLPYTTGILPLQQGSNSSYTGTAAFTASSSVLIVQSPITTRNPNHSEREVVYYDNSPYGCGTTARVYNDVALLKHIYFLDGTELKRRTIVDFGGKTVCDVGTDTRSAAIFQHNTCKSTPDNGTCFGRDEVIAKNVKSVNFEYYATPSSSSSSTPSTSTSFQSVRVTITTEKIVAGSAVSQTASLRASKL